MQIIYNVCLFLILSMFVVVEKHPPTHTHTILCLLISFTVNICLSIDIGGRRDRLSTLQIIQIE